MTFDYTRSQATALRLIQNFGQTMTWRSLTDGAYADGAVTQTTMDQTVSGVMMAFTDYEVAKELIEANDRKAVLAASGMVGVPAVKDELIVGGAAFKIISVQTLNPAGTPVLYTLQVRQ